MAELRDDIFNITKSVPYGTLYEIYEKKRWRVLSRGGRCWGGNRWPARCRCSCGL